MTMCEVPLPPRSLEPYLKVYIALYHGNDPCVLLHYIRAQIEAWKDDLHLYKYTSMCICLYHYYLPYSAIDAKGRDAGTAFANMI